MNYHKFTIFSIPKLSSNSIINDIQDNAVHSWKNQGDCNILIIGDGKQLSDKYCVDYVKNVNRNKYGTPILNNAFQIAINKFPNSLFFMYTNCDIVYPHKITPIINDVYNKYPNFLIVGRRTDINEFPPDILNSSNSFSSTKWCEYANLNGKLHIWSGIDYFIFNRDFIKILQMPEFVVGRIGFDNWIIGKAKQIGITVIDATSRILAIHQNHGYEHVLGGKDWTRNGPEALENLKLASGVPLLTIKDADIKL